MIRSPSSAADIRRALARLELTAPSAAIAALEPRIVFDAAGVAVVAQALSEAASALDQIASQAAPAAEPAAATNNHSGRSASSLEIVMGPVAEALGPVGSQIPLEPTSHAPVAADDDVVTRMDRPLTATLPVASDANFDKLSYGPGATAPAHGTLFINQDGTYTYTPEPGFVGCDSFTYTVTDGTFIVERTVGITVTFGNSAPAACADKAEIAEDTPCSGNLLANDRDLDGHSLSVRTFSIHGDPTVHPAGTTAALAGIGTLVVSEDGSYAFTPEANFCGSVPRISYTIVDADGGQAESGLHLRVYPLADAPEGADNAVALGLDGRHAFSPGDFGFSDSADGSGDVLAAVIITTLPEQGTLALDGVPVQAGQVINAEMLNRLVFTAAPRSDGQAFTSFSFQVMDTGSTGGGGSNVDPTPNTISLALIRIPAGPVAQTDAAPQAVESVFVPAPAITGGATGGPLTGSALLGAPDEMRPSWPAGTDPVGQHELRAGMAAPLQGYSRSLLLDRPSEVPDGSPLVRTATLDRDGHLRLPLDEIGQPSPESVADDRLARIEGGHEPDASEAAQDNHVLLATGEIDGLESGPGDTGPRLFSDELRSFPNLSAAASERLAALLTE